MVSLGWQTGLMTPYLRCDPRVKKSARLREIVDETTQVRRALGRGIIREEVWQDSRGVVTKYNLAFINHALVPEITAGWRATTTATVIGIGISPEPTKNLLLSSTRGGRNDF